MTGALATTLSVNISALSETLSTFEICQEPEIAWEPAFGRLLLATLVIVLLPVTASALVSLLSLNSKVAEFSSGKIVVMEVPTVFAALLLDDFYGSVIHNFGGDRIEIRVAGYTAVLAVRLYVNGRTTSLALVRPVLKKKSFGLRGKGCLSLGRKSPRPSRAMAKVLQPQRSSVFLTQPRSRSRFESP